MIAIAGSAEKKKEITQVLKGLSGNDFRLFGLGNLAYIRPVTVDGKSLYAICGADGTPLSVVDNMAAAHDILLNNEMSTRTSRLH